LERDSERWSDCHWRRSSVVGGFEPQGCTRSLSRGSIVPLLIIEARIEFGPREVRVFRRVIVSAWVTAKYAYAFCELEVKVCGEKGDFGPVTVLDVRAGRGW
jgi:hypothetical protein